MYTTKQLKLSGWLLLGGLLALGAVATVFGFSRRIAWFDEFMHTATPFAMAFVIGLHAFTSIFDGTRRYSVRKVALVATAVLAVGVFWELAEWLYDRAVPGNVFKGKDDTMWDLALDACGALGGSILAYAACRSLDRSGRRKGDWGSSVGDSV